MPIVLTWKDRKLSFGAAYLASNRYGKVANGVAYPQYFDSNCLAKFGSEIMRRHILLVDSNPQKIITLKMLQIRGYINDLCHYYAKLKALEPTYLDSLASEVNGKIAELTAIFFMHPKTGQKSCATMKVMHKCKSTQETSHMRVGSSDDVVPLITLQLAAAIKYFEDLQEGLNVLLENNHITTSRLEITQAGDLLR